MDNMTDMINMDTTQKLDKVEVNGEQIVTYYEQVNEFEGFESSFHIILSMDEKIRCVEEILSKVKKILYVYDKSLEEKSNYNYKVYVGGILIYVSSSNVLFKGELISIIVNLNAILINNFSKTQLKRIVFETRNILEYMLKNFEEQQENILEKDNNDDSSNTAVNSSKMDN